MKKLKLLSEKKVIRSASPSKPGDDYFASVLTDSEEEGEVYNLDCLGGLSLTPFPYRAVVNSSSKPLHRQLTWGGNGPPEERSAVSKPEVRHPNVGPQQPPDDNPFLIHSMDLGDNSVSHTSSSSSSSSLARRSFIILFRVANTTVNIVGR